MDNYTRYLGSPYSFDFPRTSAAAKNLGRCLNRGHGAASSEHNCATILWESVAYTQTICIYFAIHFSEENWKNIRHRRNIKRANSKVLRMKIKSFKNRGVSLNTSVKKFSNTSKVI